ncbi:MAG: helix-turn-helix domain-containing protein [Cyclobacteriaceae bacterium]
MDTINLRAKAVREMLSLHQHEIAEFLNISQRDLSLFENGKRKSIIYELIEFYIRLGIDANYFFDSFTYTNSNNYLNRYQYKLAQLRLGSKSLKEMVKSNFGCFLAEEVNQIPYLSISDQMAYTNSPDRHVFMPSLPYMTVPFALSEGRYCYFQHVSSPRNGMPEIYYSIAMKVDAASLSPGNTYVLVTDLVSTTKIDRLTKNVQAEELYSRIGFNSSNERHEAWLVSHITYQMKSHTHST